MNQQVLSVVIIDEDESQGWALAHRLEFDPQDFQITLSPTLEDAETRLEALSIDAVLIGTGSVEVKRFQEVCERHRETAFLVVVDEVSGSLIERYGNLGAQDVVSRHHTGSQELLRAIQFGVYRCRAERDRSAAEERERKLRSSERRLLDVLDEIAVLIGTTNVAGGISYMNAAARAFWATDGGHYRGTPLQDLIAPSAHEWLTTEVFPQFLSEGRWQGTIPLVSGTGEIAEADVTMLIHYDDEQRPFFSSIGRLLP